MNLLDLYEGREPYQQAIDKLEQARIDHLKEKMDYYAKHKMAEQFKKAKEEHDSYFKVQDECMGYGSLGEGAMKDLMWRDAERMSREQFCAKHGEENGEFWDNINGGLDEAGIGQDIVNKTEKMARATPPTKAGAVASTVKNAAKWLAGKGGPGKEGPTYESQDQKKNSEKVEEGWSNKMVARRTGQLPTPYSVYIKGKEWKSFADDDHAENVANKLRAKFKQEGKDPSVITIAPSGLTEATGDAKFDRMMGRIGADPWTQLNSDPNWEYEIEELVDQHIEPWLLAMRKSGIPITQDEETLNPDWRKRYEQVSTQLAQKYIASKKFNPRDPDLVGRVRAAIDNHTDQSSNVQGQLTAYADDLPYHRYADAFDNEMTANIRDAMAGVIGARDNDDDDDGDLPTRPRPTANPGKLDPGNMEEGIAEAQTDYQKRRQRERDVDAGKPVAKPRQPKMTDYQKRRAQQKKEMELGEDQDNSGVERAILNRIMVAHTDLLMKFGPEKVMQAAEEVAYNVGDVDEIGTSDVSAWVHEVKQILGA